ncbi:helix-turn-helix domain-containing protein [Sphaerisporangium perillae]|uniref:helix-turn-helix domain-containing protein n=1 Tax=Sphaerisporangium perillae TaxID=2935860 RepID=UPI00355657E5
MLTVGLRCLPDSESSPSGDWATSPMVHTVLAMPTTNVRKHLRRLRDGRVVQVRAHPRRLPTNPVIVGGGGLIVALFMLFGIGFILSQTGQTPAVPGRGASTAPVRLAGVHADLAQALTAARQHAGMSRVQAATQAGMSESEIASFEEGTLTPDATDVDALCNAYGLTPEARNELMALQWKTQ